MIRETLEQAVLKTLQKLELPTDGVVVEFSDDGFGDITTNAAMICAKAAGKSPREVAAEIITALGTVEGVEKIETAGPGFINFTLTGETLREELAVITPDTWGKNNSQEGKRVMVEYTDPNPFKEFHIGHLMSNAIGESVARLIEYSSADVHRANYQGDVGQHVAKAIWGKMQREELEWGAAYAYGAAHYDENKEAIDTINKEVYDHSNSEVEALYAKGREESLAHFEKLYAILDTKFDHYFFESETTPIGLELVKSHPEVFEESEGAIVYKGEQDGLHTRVFITGQGLPTYEAKDLGLIKLKADTWPADVSITVTANEQQEYFKVMKAAAMHFMPELAEKVLHIVHGMMRLQGGKMSSRTGDVITGESLLMKLIDAAKERAAESKADDTEKLAEQIAVAAIKFQILRQAMGKDIIFDEEKALSLEGDSGPYVQYAYTRAMSVLRAGEEAGVKMSLEIPQTAQEHALGKLLGQFPDVVARAQSLYEPHHVATYAVNLAALYNSWYAQEHVLGTPDAPRRLAYTQAVATTLKNALYLLGIPIPERM